MQKQKSLNNKGFSLVELIIVIAIMAILVGVMAPNLLRYVEKTNVSADTQLADSIRTAFTVSMLDPQVINATTATSSLTEFQTAHRNAGVKISGGTVTAIAGDVFLKSVADTLGVTAADWAALEAALVAKLKSTNSSPTITVQITTMNSVIVTITGVDNTGGKTPAAGKEIVAG